MSVELKIKDVISEILDIPVINLNDDAYLNDDLGANPYDLETIAAALNDEFDIDLTEDDIDIWETIADIISIVQDQME